MSKVGIVLGTGGMGFYAAYYLQDFADEVHVYSLEPRNHIRAQAVEIFGARYHQIKNMKELTDSVPNSISYLIECTGTNLLPNYIVGLESQLVPGARVITFSLPLNSWVDQLTRNNLTIVSVPNKDEALQLALDLYQRRFRGELCLHPHRKEIGTVLEILPGAENLKPCEMLNGSSNNGVDILIDACSDEGERFEEELIHRLASNAVVAMVGDHRMGWPGACVRKRLKIIGSVSFAESDVDRATQALLKMQARLNQDPFLRKHFFKWFAPEEINVAFGKLDDALKAAIQFPQIHHGSLNA